MSRFPAVGRNARGEEMVEGLAARVAGKAPTSCEVLLPQHKDSLSKLFYKKILFTLFFFLDALQKKKKKRVKDH